MGTTLVMSLKRTADGRKINIDMKYWIRKVKWNLVEEIKKYKDMNKIIRR